MKFINLMHSDSKLLNMMLFGVEGEHWELADDGRVKIVDSAWYGAHGGAWTLGNTMLRAVSTNEDPKEEPPVDRILQRLCRPSIAWVPLPHQAGGRRAHALSAVADGMHQVMTGYVDPAVELPKSH
ncbi:MAG: hypothetical protein R2867_27215 [Caldilineaceae bacterium]